MPPISRLLLHPPPSLPPPISLSVPSSHFPPSPPRLLPSTLSTSSPSALLSPPRAPTETGSLHLSGQPGPNRCLSHLPHSAASLFLCLVPGPLLISIRTTPPVYVQSSLRFLTPCRPMHFFPPTALFFFARLPYETVRGHVYPGSPPVCLTEPRALERPLSRPSSWKRTASRPGCLSLVFGIFHSPPFFCGGSKDVLVTSCTCARGAEAIPASNERLTLRLTVLGALPSYPTAPFTRKFSACSSQCTFDAWRHCAFLVIL